MIRLFKKKLFPKRVLLLSALPDNKHDFKRYALSGESVFVRSLADAYGVADGDGLWRCYEPSAKALQTTYKKIEERGGKVIQDFALQDLSGIIDADVVVIIAHHSDNSDEIEIGGKLVRSVDFVNAIPVGSQAVIDMTSCYSVHLMPKIKAHVPLCQIIGIEVKTQLSFRLFLLEKVLERFAKFPDETYLEALKAVLASLPASTQGAPITVTQPRVHLGGKLQSTVFAPRQALVGDDFIVSVFLHKQEDMDEVEIIAREIDEKAEKRSTKRLSMKIKKGDRVDFQLSVSKQLSDSFRLDKRTKGFVWDGDIESVEFVVSVLDNCTASSFVGSLKICVNKEPVGDMVFKTEIVRHQLSDDRACADFEFVCYDKEAEMSEANSELLSRLSNKIEELSRQVGAALPDELAHIQHELEICKKCKELIQAPMDKKAKDILRVFISSTSDMKPFRHVVKERVEACEMYPDMYENWGQGNKYPRDMCCQHVLQADIFVCILGARYGFVEPMWDKSMTEIEYRIALNAGIPILIYIIANYKEELDKLEAEDKRLAPRQKQLIDEVKNKRMVGMFHNEMVLSLLASSELLTVKYKLQS